MTRPFFSIITCTYNSGKYLPDNFRSVSRQDFTSFEHIIIDGRSTDRSWPLIKKYRQAASYPVVARRSPARGIGHAFNQGIKQSRGRYLIHLNSDDYFFDDQVLSDVYQFLLCRDEPDWIYGLSQLIEADGRPFAVFPERWIFQQSWGYLMKFFPFVPHQTVFIKAAVFRRHGLFDETLRSKMDPDLWLRIKDKTRWLFYKRLICCYRLRTDAASSAKKNQEQGQRDFQLVQSRYMNRFEHWLAGGINFLVVRYNKSTR